MLLWRTLRAFPSQRAFTLLEFLFASTSAQASAIFCTVAVHKYIDRATILSATMVKQGMLVVAVLACVVASALGGCVVDTPQCYEDPDIQVYIYIYIRIMNCFTLLQ